VIHLRNLRLRRGPDPLLENASASILRGEKIGVVGRNGSGKSSLLALLRGELTAEIGEFDCPSNLVFAHVAQELPHSERPVVEHVIDGDTALRAAEVNLQEAVTADDGLAQARWLGEFERLGGYTARSRAAALLDGLGFDPAAIDRPIAEFSGGLRMRANLARALMCPSDVLLLDEPTNHLDLDAVLWLERWLQAYAGTLLLVSHDRDFLDAVIDKVLHVSQGTLQSYSGNFSSFEAQRAARHAQQQAANEKLRREIEHVRGFIERFRAKASKARQAQSRIKWLERLPTLIDQRTEKNFDWQFATPRKLPVPLVTLDAVSAGYGARVIVSGVSLSIAPGARLGILGRNGAGKSTVIKSIAGQIAPIAGQVTAATDLEVGFFAQLEVDQLDARSSAFAELTHRGGLAVCDWSEQQKRDHLGRFGFQGERAFEPIVNFSGGERARLSLAILVARRPNLLLLDEPTNHLDLEMRDALLLALQDFTGAVVLVSHDRGLLGSVCDEFVVVKDGKVEPFSGDLDDYADWLTQQSRGPVDKSAAEERRSRRREEAEARNQLAPLRAELKKIEKDLEQLSTTRDLLEAKMADPVLCQSVEAAKVWPLEHATLQKRIDELEERWLVLGTELESRGV